MSVIISFVLPLLFNGLGIMIVGFSTESAGDSVDLNAARLIITGLFNVYAYTFSTSSYCGFPGN